jgi:hypothetical protein
MRINLAVERLSGQHSLRRPLSWLTDSEIEKLLVVTCELNDGVCGYDDRDEIIVLHSTRRSFPIFGRNYFAVFNTSRGYGSSWERSIFGRLRIVCPWICSDDGNPSGRMLLLSLAGTQLLVWSTGADLPSRVSEEVPTNFAKQIVKHSVCGELDSTSAEIIERSFPTKLTRMYI